MDCKYAHMLKVKKLHPDAKMPSYATDGSACFDLHMLEAEEKEVHWYENPQITVRTGLSFEIPKGFAMLIYSRSGHGFKNSTRLANCVGVIDSDYRGEVMVKLVADCDGILPIKAGDRIAQAMLKAVPRIEFMEVEELSETERGKGGFGSTGN